MRVHSFPVSLYGESEVINFLVFVFVVRRQKLFRSYLRLICCRVSRVKIRNGVRPLSGVWLDTILRHGLVVVLRRSQHSLDKI